MTAEEKQFRLNIKTIATGIGIFFGSILLLIFIYYIKDILALIFVSFLISLAMAGPINLLHRKTKWPRGVCAAIGYFVILGLLITGIALIIPPLIQQLTDMVKKFDLTKFAQGLNDMGITISSFDSIIKDIASLSKPLFTSLAAIFGQTFQIFTMAILSFHLVMDQGKTQRRLRSITKDNRVINYLTDFMQRIKINLGGWIQGELALMLIIGLVSFIAFSLIGVPYALPMAVLAGLLELIPNLGPILAAVPAVALALTVDPIKALITLLACILIQQLENIFIVPRVMKSAAGVNPMVSIVAILIGFQIMGVAGALLALPTYILLRSAYVFFIRDQRHKINNNPA